METSMMARLEPGHSVVLTSLPPGLLSGLPREDQDAIQAIIGQRVTLVGFMHGQAELEFFDEDGDGHTIWVAPSFIRAA
jgi:hypothetical protein